MRNTKELNTVFSNTVMLYILQISGYIFPLMTFPYLTRILGPDTYGIIVFTGSSMLYFQMFVDFGFILSATSECSVHRQDKEKLAKILGAVIQAKLLLAIAGFCVLSILVLVVDVFASKRLFMLFSYLPIALSIFIPDYLFRGLEQMSILTYRSIAAKTIYTLLVFLVVKEQSGYIFLPLITSVGILITVLWTWYIIIKKLDIKWVFASVGETIVVVKTSGMFFVSRIASTAYGASNIFVLGFVQANVSIALFGVANTLISTIKALFSPIADSIYPYMLNKKDYRLIKLIIYITTPCILIGTFILFVFAEPIIRLICGNGFEGAVPVFKAMLPIVVLTLPIYLLGFPVLGAMGRMREANMSVIIGALTHIVGLGVLFYLGKLELVPVAILTCITETVVLLIRTGYVLRGRKEKELVNVGDISTITQ